MDTDTTRTTSTKRKRLPPKPKKLPRGVQAVRSRDGTWRFRSWVPTGRAGGKRWLPLVATAELAEEARKRTLKKVESLPAVPVSVAAGIERVRRRITRHCRPGTLRWFNATAKQVEKHLGRILNEQLKGKRPTAARAGDGFRAVA
jgi:hypothetical protein